MFPDMEEEVTIENLRELRNLVEELVDMLDYEEANDDGKVRRTTYFSSCRTMHCEQFGKIFPRIRELVKGDLCKSKT